MLDSVEVGVGDDGLDRDVARRRAGAHPELGVLEDAGIVDRGREQVAPAPGDEELLARARWSHSVEVGGPS